MAFRYRNTHGQILPGIMDSEQVQRAEASLEMIRNPPSTLFTRRFWYQPIAWRDPNAQSTVHEQHDQLKVPAFLLMRFRSDGSIMSNYVTAGNWTAQPWMQSGWHGTGSWVVQDGTLKWCAFSWLGWWGRNLRRVDWVRVASSSYLGYHAPDHGGELPWCLAVDITDDDNTIEYSMQWASTLPATVNFRDSMTRSALIAEYGIDEDDL